MTSKPWYTSWTVWLNVAGIVAIALQLMLDQSGALGIPPQADVWIVLVLAVLNAGLRVLKTNQPLSIAGRTPSAPKA